MDNGYIQELKEDIEKKICSYHKEIYNFKNNIFCKEYGGGDEIEEIEIDLESEKEGIEIDLESEKKEIINIIDDIHQYFVKISNPMFPFSDKIRYSEALNYCLQCCTKEFKNTLEEEEESKLHLKNIIDGNYNEDEHHRLLLCEEIMNTLKYNTLDNEDPKIKDDIINNIKNIKKLLPNKVNDESDGKSNKVNDIIYNAKNMAKNLSSLRLLLQDKVQKAEKDVLDVEMALKSKWALWAELQEKTVNKAHLKELLNEYPEITNLEKKLLLNKYPGIKKLEALKITVESVNTGYDITMNQAKELFEHFTYIVKSEIDKNKKTIQKIIDDERKSKKIISLMSSPTKIIMEDNQVSSDINVWLNTVRKYAKSMQDIDKKGIISDDKNRKYIPYSSSIKFKLKDKNQENQGNQELDNKPQENQELDNKPFIEAVAEKLVDLSIFTKSAAKNTVRSMLQDSNIKLLAKQFACLMKKGQSNKANKIIEQFASLLVEYCALKNRKIKEKQAEYLKKMNELGFGECGITPIFLFTNKQKEENPNCKEYMTEYNKLQLQINPYANQISDCLTNYIDVNWKKSKITLCINSEDPNFPPINITMGVTLKSFINESLNENDKERKNNVSQIGTIHESNLDINNQEQQNNNTMNELSVGSQAPSNLLPNNLLPENQYQNNQYQNHSSNSIPAPNNLLPNNQYQNHSSNSIPAPNNPLLDNNILPANEVPSDNPQQITVPAIKCHNVSKLNNSQQAINSQQAMNTSLYPAASGNNIIKK